MRLVLAAMLLLVASAAAAAEGWQRYDNARFGYRADVPAAFGVVEQDEARIVLKDGPRTLELFGLDLAPLGFEDATRLALQSTTDEGFAVVTQALTPGWARWQGSDGARRIAIGLVPLCGTALAGYELRYMEADIPEMTGAIARLDASLAATRDC